ncbi:threonylcarbamoyl-AMP synthase [Croceicoccus ponticola]|uniref:Threonylcarbamoyl-AMP synthase n=1 Tax=Croceicoccus ponticola TaxID=2217664 RepID=A0A437GYH1_9SPHN|nr:L-threonylcarbamoyladenylate synthase [Croceicoccus ponticola]RVQ67718.1 threonylcarbamoyl-AMP synthase [Croceicoccus ponticola]
MSEANATIPRVLPADAHGVAEAVALLKSGSPVALPTETVYGLAARADDASAVAAIYAAKGRPDFNPLIVHVPDIGAAARIAVIDDRARALADRFWPGALTLVLPLRQDAALAPAVTAGLPTVAVRIPAHPVMRAVLTDCGLPLAAPSANRSGAVSPTCAAHVAGSLAGRIELVLDGGDTERGLESTIIALRPDGWQVLRPGPVAEAQIASVLGPPLLDQTGAIEAPGQLASHYAPGKPIRLAAHDRAEGEFRIGFGADEGDFNLSPTGDLMEAASRLYAALHAAAAAPQDRIAVVPLPGEGIGEAIADRLRRAAA